MDTTPAATTLSARQERFCRAYLRAASGTEAARLAGYRPGGARTQAWRLLKDPRVRARIQSLRAAGGLPAPRHALELLAKLERLYESALACGNHRAGVAAVEAQARLIDRFHLDAPEGDDFGAPVPADDADIADDADALPDADAEQAGAGQADAGQAGAAPAAELFDADLADPAAVPPPDLAPPVEPLRNMREYPTELRPYLTASRRALAATRNAARPQAAPQAPPRPPAGRGPADRAADGDADGDADSTADPADPPPPWLGGRGA